MPDLFHSHDLLLSVPIPIALSKRPRAANGYVIPFVQLILPDGTPDFRIHDLNKALICIYQRRCALCGEPILGQFWFSGGDRCREHRKFIDAPAHKACLQYAFRVCPFLACPSAVYSQRSKPQLDGHYLTHKVVSQTRPDHLYAMQTKDYQTEIFRTGRTIHEIVLTADPFTQIILDEDFVKEISSS